MNHFYLCCGLCVYIRWLVENAKSFHRLIYIDLKTNKQINKFTVLVWLLTKWLVKKKKNNNTENGLNREVCVYSLLLDPNRCLICSECVLWVKSGNVSRQCETKHQPHQNDVYLQLWTNNWWSSLAAYLNLCMQWIAWTFYLHTPGLSV